MKAWVMHGRGAPDDLVLEDRPQADLLPGDVLIRNRAIGLNPADWKVIAEGHSAWPWPHTPGMDGAGDVVAIGSEVRHLEIGARVAYHADLRRPGSFAEFTAISARAALMLPDGLSWAAAAALHIATVKAISDEVVVMNRGKVVQQGPKENVLSPPYPDYTKTLLNSVPEIDPDWLNNLPAARN